MFRKIICFIPVRRALHASQADDDQDRATALTHRARAATRTSSAWAVSGRNFSAYVSDENHWWMCIKSHLTHLQFISSISCNNKMDALKRLPTFFSDLSNVTLMMKLFQNEVGAHTRDRSLPIGTSAIPIRHVVGECQCPMNLWFSFLYF